MSDYPVLIGSANYSPDNRIPTDLDFIGSLESINRLFTSEKEISNRIAEYPTSGNHKVLKTKENIFDCEIAWYGSSGEMILDYVKANCAIIRNRRFYYEAPKSILWLLKESHKYKDSVHFEKTRADILDFRKLYTNTINDYTLYPMFMKVLKLRELEAYSTSPKLNTSKNDFFGNDGIDYIIDHDRIHEHIAIYSKPAYTYIKENESEVMVSKILWNSVCKTLKYMCVIEEAMVISIERGMIPFGLLGGRVFSGLEIDNLFKISLQKICTRLTSGYFREFAWNEYDIILEKYHQYYRGYVDKFIKGLSK